MNHAKFGKHDLWNPVFVVFGWTLYAIFFASQSYLQQAYLGTSTGWQKHFIPWLICSYLWALLTPPVLLLAARFPFTLRTWHRSLIVHMPVAVALSLFQLALYVLVWNLLFGSKPGGPLEQYEGLVLEEFHAGFLVYFAIVAISSARSFFINRREGLRFFPADITPEQNTNEDRPPASPNGNGANPAVYISRIAVKENGRTLFVKTSDIDWINSEGNYVLVHTRAKRHLIRETMNAMEQKLDPGAFVRIRRSTIVRVEQIVELQPAFNGGSSLVLRDGTTLKASRRYRKRLETMLNSR